jgi:hypothetical protein
VCLNLEGIGNTKTVSVLLVDSLRQGHAGFQDQCSDAFDCPGMWRGAFGRMRRAALLSHRFVGAKERRPLLLLECVPEAKMPWRQ